MHVTECRLYKHGQAFATADKHSDLSTLISLQALLRDICLCFPNIDFDVIVFAIVYKRISHSCVFPMCITQYEQLSKGGRE